MSTCVHSIQKRISSESPTAAKTRRKKARLCGSVLWLLRLLVGMVMLSRQHHRWFRLVRSSLITPKHRHSRHASAVGGVWHKKLPGAASRRAVSMPHTCAPWKPQNGLRRDILGEESWLKQMTKTALLSTAAQDTATSTASSSTRPYHLVIVESPSKVETLSKILQQYVQEHDLPYDFSVQACLGHVRNLPRKRNKGNHDPIVGVDIDRDYQPSYEVLPEKRALIRHLRRLAAGAEHVVLATDPDREGEAMAWHLSEVVLPENISYSRVRFSEFTPSAVEASFRNHQASALDIHLIQAQETRRILDRLAGFTVSPVLWKKIAPGLSAGRVQSVGMAMLVERERQRLAFVPQSYWDLQVAFEMDDGKLVQGQLISVDDTPIVISGADFKAITPKRCLSQQDAEELQQILQNATTTMWTVVKVQYRDRSQRQPMAFRTSTLQQEANRRLGMSVSQTMQTAQQLYERGYISYMRTDSSQLSKDAQTVSISQIKSMFGQSHVGGGGSADDDGTNSKKKKKVKNAQEAHEAIRPAIPSTGRFVSPDQLDNTMSSAQQQIYDLIYRRTLASCMTPLKTKQTTILVEGVASDGTKVQVKITGSIVTFPGFSQVWHVSTQDTPLPANQFSEGRALHANNVTAVGHSTQPPPRYTEASLVQELEQQGVGRPSTYSHIIKLLRDRAYAGTPVDSESRHHGQQRNQAKGAAISAQRAAGGETFMGSATGPLVPSLTAFVVSSLLEKNCPTYVDPSFTAQMEEQLDMIASDTQDENPEKARVRYLHEFYGGEDGLAAQVQRIDETVAADEARRVLLPALENATAKEGLSLNVGPWGPYVVQDPTTSDSLDDASKENEQRKAPLPQGMAADLSSITPQSLKAVLASKTKNGVLLGMHPDDGREIRLKVGRFGAYLQWGTDDDESKTTHSLPKSIGGMQKLKNIEADNTTTTMKQDAEASIGDDDDASEETMPSLSDMIGLSFDHAIGYCALPRTVSVFHDMPIVAGLGPYGPYLKFNNTYHSLKKNEGDVLTIDAGTAESLVQENIIDKPSRGGGRGVLNSLGEKDGASVRVKKGRFGLYLNWKQTNAPLPKEYLSDPSSIPLDEAWELLQNKIADSGKSSSRSSTKKTKKATKEPKGVSLPPAPKRPKTAYLHFCADKRESVVTASSEKLSLGDFSKALSKLWAEASPEDRSPYEEKAKTDKEGYVIKKREWEQECKIIRDKENSKEGLVDKSPAEKETVAAAAVASESPVEISKAGVMARVEAKAGAALQEAAAGEHQEMRDRRHKNDRARKNPKRPKTAYLYFCSEKRAEVANSGLSLGDVSKELAKIWKETEDRQRYEEMAAADKVRYETEKLQTQHEQLQHVNDRVEQHIGSATLRARRRPKMKKSAQKKRAKTAYAFFCSEKRAEVAKTGLSFGEVSKELGRLWSETTERQRYEDMAAADKARLEEEVTLRM